MAFEGTKQGMQSFLAAKQAGASPLAQHLNFKSALKEARIAMAAKELESERTRGFQSRENQLTRDASQTRAVETREFQSGENKLNRDAAQTRVETQTTAAKDIALLKSATAGETSQMKIYDKAVLIAKRKRGISAFSKFSATVEEDVKKEARDMTVALLADQGMSLGKEFAAFLGVGEEEGDEVDDLLELRPDEIADRDF